MRKMDVGIQYIDGLISKDDLKELREIANKNELEFEERNVSGVVYNEIGEISNFFFFISPLFLEALANGLITNGVYDALKTMLKISANSISGKKYYKITVNGPVEETAKLHLKSGKKDLIFEIPSKNEEAIVLAIKELTSAYKEDNRK